MHSLLKRPIVKFFLVMALLTGLGLFCVGHYGVSWDEEIEVNMVKWNWELISQGKPFPQEHHLIENYGILFNAIAEVPYQIQRGFQKLITPKTSPSSYAAVMGAKIYTKHWVTFLASLIAYIAVAGMVRLISDRRSWWLAPIGLLLFPRFWGHSFFNPKDIPFASGFILATWIGVYLVNAYLNVTSSPENFEVVRLRKNRFTLTQKSILYGILVGLVSSVRLGGIVLLVFVAITYLGLQWFRNQSFQLNLLKRVGIYYGLTIVACLMTIVPFHPAAWKNPIGWFFSALGTLSQYPRTFINLFDGQYFQGNAMPWYYIPKWFAITTPEILTGLFCWGVILTGIRWAKLSQIQQVAVILLLLQIFFLPGVAILKKSTLYDEIRHFLLIIPAIAVFVVLGLLWSYSCLSSRLYALFPRIFSPNRSAIGAAIIAILILMPIVQDMVMLHPYEYTYFNRSFGGLAAAHQRYETDYWGLSLREATEWLNQKTSASLASNSRPTRQWTVEVPGLEHTVKLFAQPQLRFVPSQLHHNEPQTNRPENWRRDIDYFVAIDRFDWQTQYPHCPIVHQVQRQGVGLTIVRQCA